MDGVSWSFWPGLALGFILGAVIGVAVVLVVMWAKKTMRATSRAMGLAGSGVRVLGVVVVIVMAIGGIVARWAS